MSAEVDDLHRCRTQRADAGIDQPPHGYRGRRFDTRLGTLDLRIPKCRAESYFPDWLLEQRRRSQRALTEVIAEAYLLGVSTGRVDELVHSRIRSKALMDMVLVTMPIVWSHACTRRAPASFAKV